MQLRGIRAYCEGVRRVFDQSSSRALLKSVTVREEGEGGGVYEGCSEVIVVEWRLSGRVNVGGPLLFGGKGIPIKPCEWGGKGC